MNPSACSCSASSITDDSHALGVPPKGNAWLQLVCVSQSGPLKDAGAGPPGGRLQGHRGPVNPSPSIKVVACLGLLPPLTTTAHDPGNEEYEPGDRRQSSYRDVEGRCVAGDIADQQSDGAAGHRRGNVVVRIPIVPPAPTSSSTEKSAPEET